MTRHPAVKSSAVALAVAVLLTACSGGGDDDEDAAGRIRPGPSTSALADGTDGAAGDAGAGADAARATATNATSATSGGPSTTVAGAGTSPSAPAGPEAAATTAATAALDAFLDAMAAEDYVAARAASRDGPRAFAYYREVLQAYNEGKGATTTLRYTAREFTVASSTPARVAYAGRAVLEASTRSDEGSGTSNSEFTDPVVVLVAGRWQVASLFLGQKPITFHPANTTTRHPNAPVTLRLIGALDSGSSTAVIVAVEAEREVRAGFDDDKLRYGSSDRSPRLRLLSGNLAYFAYPRGDRKPTLWRAEVAIDGDAARISIAFP